MAGRPAWFHKFGASRPEERTTTDGIRFDSKAEMARWNQLCALASGGHIRDLERQVKFPLVLPNGTVIKTRSKGFPNGRACVYKLDFRYFDTRAGMVVHEECKGFDDEAARLRRAVVEAIYGIRIWLTAERKRAQ